jgi:hypothetical protein
MMAYNDFLEHYYINQAHTGHGGAFAGQLWQKGGARIYAGRPWQEGSGFWSSLWRIAKPLLKYVGKEAVATGVNVGTDYLTGTTMKEAVVNRGKERAAKVIKDTAAAATKRLTGRGSLKSRKRKARRRTLSRVVFPRRSKRKKTKRNPTKRRRMQEKLYDIFA